MRTMPAAICAFCLATIVAVAALALAAPPLDANGKPLIDRCRRCHSLRNLCARVGTPNPRWEKTIRLMIAYGMPALTDAEVSALATHLDGLPKGAPDVCGK
ncbi:MAG: hypothetical protein AB7E47_07540 [Desulfovibrionaceae bacterium]